jgi:hypothetical protein
VRSFGSIDGRFDAQDPFATSFRLAGLVPTPTGPSVVMARRNLLHIEQWAVSGEQVAVLGGEPSWFPPVGGNRREDGRPNSLLADAALDGEGRLWLVMNVAGPEWQAVAARLEGLTEYRPEDAAGLRVPEVRVFDINRGEYLGAITFDTTEFPRPFTVGGEVWFASVETNLAELSSMLKVYRFRVRPH